MESTLESISFRQLHKEGLDTLVEWAKAEGWNPGLHDAEAFWKTDPEGFMGCFNGDEMIGGGSIVSYQGRFGFMGFFIVKPEYRSAGLGRELWFHRRDLLLSRLNPGASIGMDGVVAMQGFYSRGGFALAFKDERHVRMGEAFEVSEYVQIVNDADFPQLKMYDEICFGFDREKFLQAWIHLPQSLCFKYEKNGQLCGFAMIRKAQEGYKIGPLFADNSDVAEALYQACLTNAVNEPVFLDIPTSNQNAVELVKKYETSLVFECGRMYYGGAVSLPIEKIFGITSFELG